MAIGVNESVTRDELERWLEPDMLRGELEVRSIAVENGQATGRVVATNRGRASWAPALGVNGIGAFALGIRGYDRQGGRLEMSRVYLLRPVDPDEEVTFDFSLPIAPRLIELELDLVVEGLTWFSDLGGAVARQALPFAATVDVPTEIVHERRPDGAHQVEIRVHGGNAAGPTTLDTQLAGLDPTRELAVLVARAAADFNRPQTLKGSFLPPASVLRVAFELAGTNATWELEVTGPITPYPPVVPRACTDLELWLEPGMLRAEIHVESATIEQGRALATVVATNRGEVPWGPGPQAGGLGSFAVGVRGIDRSGEALEMNRVYLIEPVAPGDQVTLTLSLPIAPRIVELELDIVAEGLTWFGDLGGAVARQPLTLPAAVDVPTEIVHERRPDGVHQVEIRVHGGNADDPTTLVIELAGLDPTRELAVLVASTAADFDRPHTFVGSFQPPAGMTLIDLELWGTNTTWQLEVAGPITPYPSAPPRVRSITADLVLSRPWLHGTIEVIDRAPHTFGICDPPASREHGAMVVVVSTRRDLDDPWQERQRIRVKEARGPDGLRVIEVDVRLPPGTGQVSFITEDDTLPSRHLNRRLELTIEDLPGYVPERRGGWFTRALERLEAELDGAVTAWSYHRRIRRLQSLQETGETAISHLGRNELKDLEAAPRAHGGRRPRVLIVAPCRVFPTEDVCSTRIFNLIRHTSAGLELHLLTTSSTPPDPQAKAELLRYCKSVTQLRLRPERTRFFAADPPSAQVCYAAHVEAKISELVALLEIEVLQLETTEMAQYARADGGAKVLLVEHELAFLSLQRRLALDLPRRFPASSAYGRSPRDVRRLMRYEAHGARGADLVVTTSETDRTRLTCGFGIAREKVVVIRNAAEIGPPTAAFAEPGAPTRDGRVLFLGDFSSPAHCDALEMFVQETWPLIRALRPNSVLTVAGAGLPAPVRAQWHGFAGIKCLGFVDDPAKTLREHRVMVVPLRASSGTGMPIVEAFAAGLPVVSSAMGVEGMPVKDGEDFLCAETPLAFAKATIRLLDDQAFANGLAAHARNLASDLLTWRKVADDQVAAIGQLVRQARCETSR